MTSYVCSNFVQDGAIVLSIGVVVLLWFVALIIFILTAVAFFNLGVASTCNDCTEEHHEKKEEDTK